MPKKKKVPDNHYIDNEKFYEELSKYKKLLEEKPEEAFPEYLGECFLAIATNLSYRPNFIGYTYKQDMIGDAVENCLRYWDRFDPEKSKNPFGYFSQISWWAFVRRITAEKKQTELKMELCESEDLFNDITETQDLDFRQYSNQKLLHAQSEFKRTKEKIVKKKKKKKSKPFALETFLV